MRTAQVGTKASRTKGGEWELASLLGRFGHDLTGLVDLHLGSEWAENDEILTLLTLRHDMGPTTRELAGIGGLHRRAVSRLVGRLVSDGIVTTRSCPTDGRSVRVDLTPTGAARFTVLEGDAVSLFRRHRDTASRICEVLRFSSPRVHTQYDPLDLLERLARAGAELVSSIDTAAGATALSGSQRTALVRIAAQPGVRPVDLVPTLGFGRSGVAYVVDQLCDKGLVARWRDSVAADARAVHLRATNRGYDAARAVSKAAALHRLRLGPLFAAVRDWE